MIKIYPHMAVNSHKNTISNTKNESPISNISCDRGLSYPLGFNHQVTFRGTVSSYDKDQKSQWYDAYIKLGNEKKEESTKIGELMNSRFFPSKSEPIAVLDIGSGNGFLSKKVIHQLLQKFPGRTISYDGVDNSTDLLSLFTKACTSEPKNVITTSILQDFFKEKQQEGKYDFVVAAHSMYRKDLNTAVHTVQDSLKPGGMAFIIRSNPSSLMNYFYDKYHIENDANKMHHNKSFMADDTMVRALREEKIDCKKIGVPFSITIPYDLKDFEESVKPKGIIAEEYKDLKNVLSFIIDTPLEETIKNGKFSELIDDMSNVITNGKMHALNNLFMLTKH